MHDCSLPSTASARPAGSPGEARRLAGEDWGGVWCGDVYKTVLHLRSQRPDLDPDARQHGIAQDTSPGDAPGVDGQVGDKETESAEDVLGLA
jgi:hypothetical protein